MNINQGWERVRKYAGFGGMTISLIAVGLGFGLVGCSVSDEEDKRTTRLIEGDLSVAKNALAAGKMTDAIKLAEELEKLAPKYQDDWNYGNAVQVANHVLGRIALSKGDVAEAKKRLLASADSEGSPQMNSFGPNMQLARELLAKGERDTVLKYFELCRKFWMMGGGSLDRWTQEVKAGKTPDFGANLSY